MVVRGTLQTPAIEAREELEVIGDAERFIFHRAAEMQKAAAVRELDRAKKSAVERGRAELGRLLRDIPGVARCAIVATEAEMTESLEDILAVHARIHAAEGCFYRDVWKEAAEAQGIETSIIAPKKLEALAARAMGVPASEIGTLLSAAGKIAGRPWAKDQKLASLAAWTSLKKK